MIQFEYYYSLFISIIVVNYLFRVPQPGNIVIVVYYYNGFEFDNNQVTLALSFVIINNLNWI